MVDTDSGGHKGLLFSLFFSPLICSQGEEKLILKRDFLFLTVV